MNDGGLEKESSHESEKSEEGGGARHFCCCWCWCLIFFFSRRFCPLNEDASVLETPEANDECEDCDASDEDGGVVAGVVRKNFPECKSSS